MSQYSPNAGLDNRYNNNYPPSSDSRNYYNNQFAPASSSSNVYLSKHNQSATDYSTASSLERGIVRTPSPTPSELEELRRPGVFDWKAYMNWRFWIRREWLWYYVITIIIVVISALITIYHKQIVYKLQGPATWMKDLKFGWLIPIAILFVISFPPLFGHEIVAILCGVVWGLWVGFAITAAGTVIGEIGNFYAFRYFFRNHAAKMEKEKISYACLAHVVRRGGFKVALIARLSAVPGHFTTVIFSTCGMNIFTFLIAAILSTPKQFVTVYLGVLLEQSGQQETTKQKLISDAVVAVTIIITALACWYLLTQMNSVKEEVIHERRRARGREMQQNMSAPYGGSSVAVNARSSDTDVPLTSTNYHQQWDSSGNAIGTSHDPRLHAPQPTMPARIPTFRTESGGGYNTSGERYGANSNNEVGVEYPAGHVPVRQLSHESQPSSNPSPAPIPQQQRVASPIRNNGGQQNVLRVQPSAPAPAPAQDATLPLQYAPQVSYTPLSAPATPSVESASTGSYPMRMGTYPLPQQQQPYGYYPQGPQHTGSPVMFNPQTTQTPTQAQFVTMPHQQHPHQQTMDVTSPPLQTPSYPSEIYAGMTTPTYASPQQTYNIPASLTPANTGGVSSQHGHGAEPTDGSIHIAMSHSGHVPPPPRTYTESPPSYTSGLT